MNPTKKLKRSGDKLLTFQTLQDVVSIPPFTTDIEEAKKFKFPVVCRTILNGHSGKGIVIAESEEELVPAPLYVQYIPKKEEYRVHVFDGKVIFKQRKAKRLDAEEVNWKIRNHDNGFVFQQNDFELPEDCAVQALKAIETLELDFGAVDVIWNEKNSKAYVLEINTAPGLEGATAKAYAKAIVERLR